MLTIILTTFNRPQYLNRFLNYSCLYKLKYRLLIGDASQAADLKYNQEIIDSASNVLGLRHLVFDSFTHQYEVFFSCLKKVDTRYVVWIADDDFVVPMTLDNVVTFLDNNLSYEAAQGKQIQLKISNDGPFSDSVNTASLSMVDFSVEAASAAARIRKRVSQNTRLSAPKSCYCVMRTSNALRLYKEVLSLGLNNSYTEAMMNQMLLLSGNIKLLDKLYIARQNHRSNAANRAFVRYVPIISQSSTLEPYQALVDKRLEKKEANPPDYFDQLVDPLFPIQYERMTNCLANELLRQDGVNIEEARRIIKHWQWYFMAKNMMPKFYEHGGGEYLQNGVSFVAKSASKQFRQWARDVPFLRKMWWKVSDKISGDEMSLSSLLSPKSPYHEDFMPIYRAITTPPDEFNESGRKEERGSEKCKQL